MITIGIFSDKEINGEDWKFLRANFQGKFFYDAENITRTTGHNVGVWLKIVYSKEFKEKEGFGDLNQTVGLWEINCEERKICLLSTSHTSEGGGTSVPNVFLPPEWMSIAPDTIMDSLYKELCE